MQKFTVQGTIPRWDRTFYTTDRWEGVWVPVALLHRPVERDGKFPDHHQEHGTCQVQGERNVRQLARSYVKDFDEEQAILADESD